MLCIDRLVKRAVRNSQPSDMETSGILASDYSHESTVLWNSMSNGQYFLHNNGCHISHEDFIKALARDLAQGNALSLSENYDPKCFIFFLDIDWKVIGPPQSKCKYVLDNESSQNTFMYEDGFVEQVTEQCMKCLAFTTTNTQDVKAIVTTKTDQDGCFSVYTETRRVCPFCNNELSTPSLRQVCRKCKATFVMNSSMSCVRYVQGTCELECHHDAPPDCIPYNRQFYSLGFHIRFHGLKTDVQMARILAGFMRTYLTKWLTTEQSFFLAPSTFFEEAIDFSCYGKGKGLRVVKTMKTKRCPECNNKIRDCPVCGGRKLILNKAYDIFGICVFKMDNSFVDDTVKTIKTMRNEILKKKSTQHNKFVPTARTHAAGEDDSDDLDLSESDMESDMDDDNVLSNKDKTTLRNLELGLANVRVGQWIPKWQNLRSEGKMHPHLKPRTQKQYRDVLRLTSIRMVPPNAVFPRLDPSYPLPVEQFVTSAKLKSHTRRTKFLNTKMSQPFMQTTCGVQPVYFDNMKTPCFRQADIEVTDSFKAVQSKHVQEVPKCLHKYIMLVIKSFDEHYQNLFFPPSNLPKYTTAKKDRILVSVNGYNSTYCCHIKDRHSSNRIYFVLHMGGVTQKCHNKSRCKDFKGKTKPMNIEYAQLLFGRRNLTRYNGALLNMNCSKLRLKYPFLFPAHEPDAFIHATIQQSKKDVFLQNEMTQAGQLLQEGLEIVTLTDVLTNLEQITLEWAAVFGNPNSKKYGDYFRACKAEYAKKKARIK